MVRLEVSAAEPWFVVDFTDPQDFTVAVSTAEADSTVVAASMAADAGKGIHGLR